MYTLLNLHKLDKVDQSLLLDEHLKPIPLGMCNNADKPAHVFTNAVVNEHSHLVGCKDAVDVLTYANQLVVFSNRSVYCVLLH